MMARPGVQTAIVVVLLALASCSDGRNEAISVGSVQRDDGDDRASLSITTATPSTTATVSTPTTLNPTSSMPVDTTDAAPMPTTAPTEPSPLGVTFTDELGYTLSLFPRVEVSSRIDIVNSPPGLASVWLDVVATIDLKNETDRNFGKAFDATTVFGWPIVDERCTAPTTASRGFYTLSVAGVEASEWCAIFHPTGNRWAEMGPGATFSHEETFSIRDGGRDIAEDLADAWANAVKQAPIIGLAIGGPLTMAVDSLCQIELDRETDVFGYERTLFLTAGSLGSPECTAPGAEVAEAAATTSSDEEAAVTASSALVEMGFEPAEPADPSFQAAAQPIDYYCEDAFETFTFPAAESIEGWTIGGAEDRTAQVFLREFSQPQDAAAYFDATSALYDICRNHPEGVQIFVNWPYAVPGQVMVTDNAVVHPDGSQEPWRTYLYAIDGTELIEVILSQTNPISADLVAFALEVADSAGFAVE
jgi:hypothetical protein